MQLKIPALYTQDLDSQCQGGQRQLAIRGHCSTSRRTVPSYSEPITHRSTRTNTTFPAESPVKSSTAHLHHSPCTPHGELLRDPHTASQDFTFGISKCSSRRTAVFCEPPRTQSQSPVSAEMTRHSINTLLKARNDSRDLPWFISLTLISHCLCS